MAQDFGWSPTVAGLVQSSFFYGYALTQIPGGYVTSRIGGRAVLPAGVTLWSAATAAVPLLAGTIPGEGARRHSCPSEIFPTLSLRTCCLPVHLGSLCRPGAPAGASGGAAELGNMACCC